MIMQLKVWICDCGHTVRTEPPLANIMHVCGECFSVVKPRTFYHLSFRGRP